MSLKFSVITVAYNSETTIEKTICSVIAQKCSNIEYIIVDGKSTDKTVDIIKRYESYITKWVSEPDQGIYDAMNKGISMASGDIISFLNSDDWYEEGIFERLEELFTTKKCDAVSGSIILWHDGKKAWDYHIIEEKEQLFSRMIYAHPATFVKRNVFEQYGVFDLSYKIVADYDWFFRIQLANVDIFRTDEKFANYSLDGESSKGTLNQIKEEYSIRTKYAALIENEKRKQIDQDIELVLDEAVNRYININLLKIISKNRGALSGKLFEKNNKWSVFGAGIRLKNTLDLLEQIGIEINCIYDNHIVNAEQYGHKIISFEEYNREYLVVSTEKYYDEIKQQLSDKKLVEYKDFCSKTILEKRVCTILREELKKQIRSDDKTGNFCFE